jgi:hypothetical protein
MIDAEISVYCTNNGRSVIGHVLTFKEDKYIQIAINTVKVTLNYNTQFKEYVGSMSGLEMIVKNTDLPKWRDSYGI